MRNLVALVGIQGSNSLVPLLVVPFALTMVGTDAYAQIAITEALSALALAAILFSFDVDGVARIAKLEKSADNALLGAALSAILAARLLLFAIMAPLMLLGYWLAQGERIDLLAWWLLVPLGQIFHSYWFYQAIEDNFVPAVVTLLSRVATIGIVAGFVRTADDAALVPLAIGLPFVAGGLVSILYLLLIRRIPVRRVPLTSILSDLRHGKEVFAGNVAVSLYREMNVVILGVVGAPAAGIATYALVEKSIKMLQACTRPLNQLFFPKVLRDLSTEVAPNRAIARRIARYTLPQIGAVLALIAVLPVGFLVASAFIPQLRALGELPEVGTMAAIMAPTMVFGLVNFMYGTAGLNALNQRGYFFGAILATGLFSVVACFALATKFGAVGAAVCFVLSEALLFLLVMSRYRSREHSVDTPRTDGRAI